jgi:hypothetical protein
MSTTPEPHDVSSVIGSVIFPSGTTLLNGVSASFGLEIVSWRPGRRMKHVRSPIMVCVCEQDSVAPARPTIAYARQAPRGELKIYPYSHFSIYIGEPFEQVFRDQVEFLQRVLPPHSPRSTQDNTAASLRN